MRDYYLTNQQKHINKIAFIILYIYRHALVASSSYRWVQYMIKYILFVCICWFVIFYKHSLTQDARRIYREYYVIKRDCLLLNRSRSEVAPETTRQLSSYSSYPHRETIKEKWILSASFYRPVSPTYLLFPSHFIFNPYPTVKWKTRFLSLWSQFYEKAIRFLLCVL
jgi:hypothetical protein